MKLSYHFSVRNFPLSTSKKARIEIIPMIDVMMFLLVFFVLISMNVIPAMGLKTQLPTSTTAKEEHPPKRIILSLLKDGAIQLDGTTINDLNHLSQLIYEKKRTISEKVIVVINGDESATMQRLIDVMDVLKKTKIDSMTIAARNKL
jgi:biopolymer transport protein ExbD